MAIFNGGKQTASWARDVTNKLHTSSKVFYTEKEKFKHFFCWFKFCW